MNLEPKCRSVMMHRFLGNAGRAVACVASLSLLVAGLSTSASAQWLNGQSAFGPLVLAMDIAYGEWLAGPLQNKAPKPAAFTATIEATSSPYTITFSETPGHDISGGSYQIPSSEVIDPAWKTIPVSLRFPSGPLTLSGLYVRSYISAYTEHLTYKQSLGAFNAFQNSTGAGVKLSTLAGGKVLVGFYQRVEQTGSTVHVGCFKEQHYLVDSSGFTATKTNIGC